MPGKIAEEILIALKNRIPNLRDLRIADIRIGLGYTGVQLNDGNAGVCHTPSGKLVCCQKIERAGTISGSAALEIAELANSWKMYEAMIGIATINALSQIILRREGERYLFAENCDIIDQIRIDKEDTVALVGYIRPFVSRIKSAAKNLYILERDLPIVEEEGVPDTACEEIIPKADVVIVTGTSIINGTIDRILELSENAREVAIAGPTASMIPDPLFSRGATITGGIKIINVQRLLQIISEGGGVPHFKNACKQIIIKPKH